MPVLAMYCFLLDRLSFVSETNVRVNSSHEHPPGKPRAFDVRWVSGAGHLAVNSVPAPRAFAISYQITKYSLRNTMSSFPTTLRVKGFKHRHFGIRRTFIDHRRPIKRKQPFALSLFNRLTHFVTCFMPFYWAETVVFINPRTTKLFAVTSYQWGEGVIWTPIDFPNVTHKRSSIAMQATLG